jgi:hypothetical protein
MFYVLCFIFNRFVLTRFFGRFVTRGVQKHEKQIEKPIWAHHKKNGVFVSSVFVFFSLGCLLFGSIFLIAFLGVL